MTSKDFLVEIGTEELPPKALRTLSEAFRSHVVAGLKSANLSFDEIKVFASPRRLALLISDLLTNQPDQAVEKFGPAIKAAFDAGGNPTPAATGFARSCGVTVDALQKAVLDGVEKLVFRRVQVGRKSNILLPAIVSEALAALPVPKRMRWGSSRIEFVRPVHWVVMLFGSDVVDAEVLGIRTGRETRGHRFHHPDSISLKQPADYEQTLFKSGSVIADFEQRKETIRKLVLEEGLRLQAKVNIDEALLDEVTSLVEWPVALTGSFDRHFLNLPAEVLVSSMKAHQKCFTLTDESGKLLPAFITVSNLRSRDPAQVISGNEKVIRPRLADAKFFFDSDQKQPLESRLESLKGIVFQQQLGSVYDKSQRVAALATLVADKLGADRQICVRAALLSKCDLVTNMVSEFGELQGIMGYYYASADGESPDVALAINEHYLPRYSGDLLPSSLTGSVVAIADKLDVIAGLFAIGQPPTGSKDPFALRRAAIGVLRILVEKQFDLDLRDMIVAALGGYKFLTTDQNISEQVFDFMLERFRSWYHDEGISSEVFQSVLALRPTNPLDFHSRILAVHHFSKLPQAQALSSANKRVSNILSKLEQPLVKSQVRLELLTVAAENQLARAMEEREPTVTMLFSQRRYKQGLEQLAELKDPIDAFFDGVLVMDKDDAVRINRLALLTRLRSLFLQVADISFLHQT